jgi:ribonuclease P protein component
MSTQKQFTLGATERLKSRKLIERLFKEGENFSLFPFRVLYFFLEENSSGLQAGFSASSRNFKKATDRNRIKRLIKEAYRLQKNELAATLKKNGKQLIVFFIYTGKELSDYNMLQKKMIQVLQKLITLTDDAPSGQSKTEILK